MSCRGVGIFISEFSWKCTAHRSLCWTGLTASLFPFWSRLESSHLILGMTKLMYFLNYSLKICFQSTVCKYTYMYFLSSFYSDWSALSHLWQHIDSIEVESASEHFDPEQQVALRDASTGRSFLQGLFLKGGRPLPPAHTVATLRSIILSLKASFPTPWLLALWHHRLTAFIARSVKHKSKWKRSDISPR